MTWPGIKRGLRSRSGQHPERADWLATATSASTKIALRHVFLRYLAAVADGSHLPGLDDTGFRVFSQVDEDGKLLFLLANLDVRTARFVDIGAGDCVTSSNTANLAFNLGFHGLCIDAREDRIERGRQIYASHPDTTVYPPRTRHAFVTRENVNDLIKDAGLEGQVDVLSIDVDGNDHWIWEAIECVAPSIVIIETHTEYRLHDISAPYVPQFDWRDTRHGEPVGASPVAMTALAGRLGYRLVGGNRYGFNAFYVQESAAQRIPTVEPGALLNHDWSKENNEWSWPPAAESGGPEPI
jgi:hypothetical protein